MRPAILWNVENYFDVGCSVHDEYVNNTKVQLTFTCTFTKKMKELKYNCSSLKSF
jgi:hypothetical protein